MPPAPFPPPQKLYPATSDGLRLNAYAWHPTTDAPPRGVVAVVHGWSDHAARYGHLVNALLPAGYAVAAVDLRGHGRSPGGRGHINAWDDYRNDVRAFLGTVQSWAGSAPFLLGHSMGGLAVMDYALHHPDAPLRGLVATSPLLTTPTLPAPVVTLMRVLDRVLPTLPLNPGANADTISRDPSVVADYKADPLVHKRVTPRAARQMEERFAWVAAHADGLRHPFLMMWGEADGLVPPRLHAQVFARVGSADKTHHAYPGGYHELFNDTDNARVLADLVAWLGAH